MSPTSAGPSVPGPEPEPSRPPGASAATAAVTPGRGGRDPRQAGLLGLLADGEGAELLDPAAPCSTRRPTAPCAPSSSSAASRWTASSARATYHALEEARWRLGDRILFFVPARLMAGDDVAALQQRLLDMGFDCGRVDGLFGVETEQALREFQRNIGVVADGTCGPATFKALDQLSRTVVGGRPHAMRDSEAINRAGPALAGKLSSSTPATAGHDPDAGPDAWTRARWSTTWRPGSRAG